MNKKAMGEKALIFYGDFWRNLMEILKQDSKNLAELIDRNVKFISSCNELQKMLA
jgi:hypothetical protein